MARSEPPPLTEAQLAIMRVVWERGRATVAEVTAALAERRLARNTVLTTMQRLEEKGWLRHREQGGAFVYESTRPQERTLATMARRLLDGAFGGKVDALVSTLLRERGLSAEEAERLRRLIDGKEQP